MGHKSMHWGRAVIRERVWWNLGYGLGLINGAELALPSLLWDWKATGI